ncbi:dicarboxylate/amino acid:cation symporter [Jeotgalibacillus sp. R-1-5s-1]|uniref:dicarboxylate/amino acid:cation symporter n=1 Tax=Jeotgalibacillus sp. R-1-5s-1 TaxID=2555897 RepID=UPI00106A2F30|nr:dicarboxylate/amino acid:cation symporter [Jeotgalibacillus sp. R-1-5s-1]TFD97684.1 dicarboxylate/amino acid:cation symporter [Jeotgalibacillus sp. R-1-5s-1]
MKLNLTAKILIGLVLGMITGLVLNVWAPDLFGTLDTYLFNPLGQIFLGLINMLVVPIVFFSLVLGVAGLGDTKKLGRMGVKTIATFLTTTAIAITIGLLLASAIQPGSNAPLSQEDRDSASYEAEETPSVGETLLDIIPSNPIQALAEGNMLQIIAFSIFIGIALTVLGEKTKGIYKLVEQGNEIFMYLVGLVMKFAPYGTFGLIASALGEAGFESLQSILMYVVVVLLALVIHAIVTYGSIIAFLAKKNPIWFFKGFAPAMTVGFSTSSSNATLPISMETAQKNLNVSKPASSFVQPLGATINMDGTAIMQGVATIFIAQVYGIELTFIQLVTVVLTAVLASIGTAGVPGVGLILLALVLNQVGLPVAGIGLILGIDRLLDMCRTAINISGDAAVALYISESEKKRKIKQQRGEA